jgi:TRAP-type mannitol/chloroaromatic compound transport system substrate-binding protein
MGGWFRNEVTRSPTKGTEDASPVSGGRIDGAHRRVAAGARGDSIRRWARGAVDATEWVGPCDDGSASTDRQALLLGWWEPCSMYHVMINMAKWDSLPKQYQEAMISAARETNLDMVAEYDAKNRQALVRLKAAGVQLHKFSDDIMEGSYKAATELYEEQAAKNPKFKKIYDDWKIFRAEEAQWFALTESALDQFYSSKLKI